MEISKKNSEQAKAMEARYKKARVGYARIREIICPKQELDDGIYCGYYIGCFIEDILATCETNMNVNFSSSPTLKSYSRDKMLCFQKNWAGYM